MPAKEDDVRYEVIWLIRRMFRAMAKTADEYLADSDLTSADRAVMEFLYPDHARSVPEIAGLYNVSRQHVQVTVNRLLDRGLLVSTQNPRHKRSPLISLAENGRLCFAEIRRHEASLVEGLFAGIDDVNLHATHETLAALLQRLD